MNTKLLINEITDELNASSDRAVAILGGSIVEALLKKLILHVAVVDKRFEGDINRSPFSVASNLAYAFGIISADLRNDLDFVYRIRNEYAHTYKPANFEQPPISGYVDNLLAGKRFGHIKGNPVKGSNGEVAKTLRDLPRRMQYIAAVIGCSATMEHLVQEVPRTKPSTRFYVDPKSNLER